MEQALQVAMICSSRQLFDILLIIQMASRDPQSSQPMPLRSSIRSRPLAPQLPSQEFKKGQKSEPVAVLKKIAHKKKIETPRQEDTAAKIQKESNMGPTTDLPAPPDDSNRRLTRSRVHLINPNQDLPPPSVLAITSTPKQQEEHCTKKIGKVPILTAIPTRSSPESHATVRRSVTKEDTTSTAIIMDSIGPALEPANATLGQISPSIEKISPLVVQINPVNNIMGQTISAPAKSSSLPIHIQNSIIPVSSNLSLPAVTSQLSSPFGQFRKSYRKVGGRQIVAIPYRRCHEVFEGRVVSILNKLETGRNCHRDFQGLIDRIPRLTSRELLNRYVIAGIATILNLSKSSNISLTQPTLLQRLTHQYQQLKTRIGQELQSTEEFDKPLLQCNQSVIDSRQYRCRMIRKVYRMLKRRGDYERLGAGKLREMAVNGCEQYINGSTSLDSLVRFLKQIQQPH